MPCPNYSYSVIINGRAEKLSGLFSQDGPSSRARVQLTSAGRARLFQLGGVLTQIAAPSMERIRS